MEQTITRIPPNSDEAERAVLASMLLERDAIGKVIIIISGPAFYRAAHQLLYETMVTLYERGEPVDIITVGNALGPALGDIGGQGYLVDLVGSIPTTAHAEYYAKIVTDKFTLRELIRVSTETIASAYAGEKDVEAISEEAEKSVLEVTQKRLSGLMSPIKDVIHTVFESIETRYNDKETLLGATTGFYDLDHMLSGFQPSDLLILAARPAMGKTALALNLCRNVAVETRKPVLMFSLEMSKEQLVQRLLCAEAGIDSHRLKTGYLAESDWAKLSNAIGVLSEAPIYIDDSAALTVSELRSKARRVIADHQELGLIMIDYLQLMSSPSSKGDDNRAAAMGAISRGMKQLARELRVPVIALSQLSRAVESRPNKRPMLSDLRESGSIEQDADIVMFIYRDEYYNPDTEKKATAEVIIAKHRSGPVGTVELYFEKSLTKFQSISTRQFTGPQ